MINKHIVSRIALVSTLPPVNTSLSEYGKFLVEGLLTVTENTELYILADQPSQVYPIQEMRNERIKVKRCWHFNAWSNPLRLLKELLQLKPDLVIFNLQFATFGNRKIPAMLGLAAPMLARKMGLKVMTVLHNLPDAMDLKAPSFARNVLDASLIRAGSRVATQMLLQSNQLVVTLERYKEILSHQYQAHNVEVIGLGSYIQPAHNIRLVKRNHFLTFGKFGTYKRLEFLLEAVQELSPQFPNLELVIGGTDHPATPGYMARVEAQYRHLKNVHFIGWIEDEDLPRRIRESKALILSYESTAGSSGPLHLALSQGKPIIAPDFGDFRLVAEHEGVDLIFYQHRCMEHFKNILTDVITGKVDLKGMSRHNLQVAKLNSSVKTARKYADLMARTSSQSIQAPTVSTACSALTVPPQNLEPQWSQLG